VVDLDPAGRRRGGGLLPADGGGRVILVPGQPDAAATDAVCCSRLP
jgi:hypothetical protein